MPHGAPGITARLKSRLNGLGALEQYQPRPLRLPARYQSEVALVDPPTISIVTPVLNGARFAEQAIQSVLGQSYPALEYVHQDGGSTDATVALLERYSNSLSSWESAPDTGQAQALNRGFGRTSGEIMAFLNADDILLPGTLAYVAGFLQSNPRIDAVYGHRIVVDAGLREIGRQLVPAHDDEVLSWADFVPQETLFWRRGAWEAAGGGFDASFDMALDWDLLLRLRDSGATMQRLPRFLGAFRVHGAQKTLVRGSSDGVAEMARIRERIHGRPVDEREVLRRVRPYLLRHVALQLGYRSGLVRP